MAKYTHRGIMSLIGIVCCFAVWVCASTSTSKPSKPHKPTKILISDPEEQKSSPIHPSLDNSFGNQMLYQDIFPNVVATKLTAQDLLNFLSAQKSFPAVYSKLNNVVPVIKATLDTSHVDEANLVAMNILLDHIYTGDGSHPPCLIPLKDLQLEPGEIRQFVKHAWVNIVPGKLYNTWVTKLFTEESKPAQLLLKPKLTKNRSNLASFIEWDDDLVTTSFVLHLKHLYDINEVFELEDITLGWLQYLRHRGYGKKKKYVIKASIDKAHQDGLAQILMKLLSVHPKDESRRPLYPTSFACMDNATMDMLKGSIKPMPYFNEMLAMFRC